MRKYFGTTADGNTANLFLLENSKGTRAEITDYGASLVRFLFNDKNGILRDLVLGYDDVSGYEKGSVFFGGIYDDRFLVKPTESAKSMMPDAESEFPYEGAKAMLLVDDVEDREFLRELLEATYPELPAPKKKK